MIPRILNQRSLAVYLLIAVVFIWLSAGFAMAQRALHEQEAAPEAIVKWGKQINEDTDRQSKKAGYNALTDYIIIMINPDSGIIYVPGSDRITSPNELAGLVQASNAAGNRIAPFSLFRWHNSPGCIFYVDSQGILRKKCTP